MHKTKIEYAEFSWNPIRGLCPVGCPYCYARKLYRRFHRFPIPPGIYLDEKELEAPLKRKKPARIFACTTFEPTAQKFFLIHMLAIMEKCLQHTFLMLSKQPDQLDIFQPPPMKNLWLGTTVTKQSEAWKIKEIAKFKPLVEVTWVSFEPLLEPIWDIDLKGVDWVVMGRLTGGRGTGPAKPRWFEELMEICATANVPIFMKRSLKNFFEDNLIQRLPI